MTISGRMWWRLCALFGLGVIITSRIMGQVEHSETHCGGNDTISPILAFEFARTPDDIAALFGKMPCTGDLVAAMDRINMIDVYAFIPLFVAFLACGALANRAHGGKLALFAAVLAISGGISDQIEDRILFVITADLPGTQAQLDRLFWFVHFKFAALALSAILTGWLLLKQELLAKIAGAAIIIGSLVSLFGLMGEPWWPLISPWMAASWAVLLGIAIWKGFIAKRRNS